MKPRPRLSPGPSEHEYNHRHDSRRTESLWHIWWTTTTARLGPQRGQYLCYTPVTRCRPLDVCATLLKPAKWATTIIPGQESARQGGARAEGPCLKCPWRTLGCTSSGTNFILVRVRVKCRLLCHTRDAILPTVGLGVSVSYINHGDLGRIETAMRPRTALEIFTLTRKYHRFH